jgi:NodT family efflux transporter outer membrane factor (OMF) lipoprotein
MNRGAQKGALLLLGVLWTAGCWSASPKYQRPSAPVPAAYKELTPKNSEETVGWKIAQPQDAWIHGKWWEVFHDPELNALEEQVNVSNQNIAAAFASYLQARAVVRQARAQYFPTLSVAPNVSYQSPSGAAQTALNTIPLEASWAPDLSGRIHSTVAQNVAAAQVSAADLENQRLLQQATLAVDYYELRGQDAMKLLLDQTILDYRKALELTRVLYETGIDSEQAVAQAETQLESTEAQATNLAIARAQYEHAIAMLVGKPAGNFSIPAAPWGSRPPVIPFGVPAQLLERRPDIAAAERAMAQANAQVGVARSAYFPTLNLTAAGGLQSTSLLSLFSLPALFWSVGATLAQTIFDGGLRKATVDQYRAVYAQAVANYRQTVLVAFQQVEDNLAGLRVLSVEIRQQEIAVRSAEKNLRIAIDRYKSGIDPYLNVITAQTTLLSNQQTVVTLKMTQMVDSVQLIEALGGGWVSSKTPTEKEILAPPPRVAPAAP